jgi:hypothetical protein
MCTPSYVYSLERQRALILASGLEIAETDRFMRSQLEGILISPKLLIPEAADIPIVDLFVAQKTLRA